MFRIYCKVPGKPFRAMDYNNGTTVGNLIHATIFTPEQRSKVESEVSAMRKMNPTMKFELRKVTGGF